VKPQSLIRLSTAGSFGAWFHGMMGKKLVAALEDETSNRKPSEIAKNGAKHPTSNIQHRTSSGDRFALLLGVEC
jgi:hypothetical protein